MQRIKDAYDEKHGYHTVVEFAAKLNEAARALGFHPIWNGPRVSQIVHGQEPTLEDAACLLQVDPQHRTWEWLVRGAQHRSVVVAPKRRVAER